MLRHIRHVQTTIRHFSNPPRVDTGIKLDSTERVEPSSIEADNVLLKDASYMVHAAGILVRNPIILRPPTEFESAYEAYRHGLQEEYSRGAFDIMTAHKRELALTQEDREAILPEFPLPAEYKEQDTASLMRQLERKLYFVVKGDAGWRFPSVLISHANVSLRAHVHRFFGELVGKECEIYHVGNTPVAYHKETMSDRIAAPFGIKLVGGKLVFTPNQSARSYAWLTKEELQEALPANYYASVKPVLSY
ncbi:hypothetical protein PSACC_03313 [Paramicrosporidium saccamoebae]|uniref:Ribosomal protein L46 N-terminal domain-containing protein n=1 Tax=Paramicrosporidium saccamoebae TaxID=1246581 RepID=A0A2H9TGH7_9FUNG|nr:hypothetical protein PSACC_03313 [Paramicrosporidium saccamoebae]